MSRCGVILPMFVVVGAENYLGVRFNCRSHTLLGELSFFTGRGRLFVVGVNIFFCMQEKNLPPLPLGKNEVTTAKP